MLFTRRDWLMIPFSLMWGGFAIFWEATVISTPASAFFMLWGVPFVLAGLFLIVGRFFADAWLRGNTRYALTDQRILIDRSAPFARFTALYLDRLPNVELIRGANGRGAIRFGLATPIWGRSGFGYWLPLLDPTPQFIAIDNPDRVFAQIQQVRRPGGRH